MTTNHHTLMAFHRLTRWTRGTRLTIVAGALIGASADLVAQSPAARLLPAVPVAEAPAKPGPVVRAAAPDYSVPAFSGPRFLPAGTPSNAPRPNTTAPTPTDSSWLQGAVSNVRDVMFGKDEPVRTWWPNEEQSSFKPVGMTFAGGQAPQAASARPGTVPPAMTTQSALPRSSTPQREFKPVGMSFAGGVPVQAQGMAPQPQTAPQAAPAAPQGVYAGPPAYRWYGWGSTTPGANPYSPNGQYPRGSANWYAQTGATPGAFPIPVSAPARGYEPEQPSYTQYPSQPLTVPRPLAAPGMLPGEVLPVPVQLPAPMPNQRVDHQYPQPSSAVAPAPLPQLPATISQLPLLPAPAASTLPEPTGIAQTPVSTVQPQLVMEPPAPAPLPVTPLMPVGPGTPIASNQPRPTIEPVVRLNEPRAPLPVPTEPQPIATTETGASPVVQADLNWQSAAPKPTTGIVPVQFEQRQPIASSPVPSPEGSSDLQWNRSTARGQAADSSSAVEQAIRATCQGRVSALKIVPRGTKHVLIVFTTQDEPTARAIASEIARLPEVKSHEISFEASVLTR